MTAPRNPVRKIVAVMAAALVCAGATVVGGATASAVPVSADRTVTASSSSGPSNCGRWQNNPGTTMYTANRDALVRSQHQVCHLSSGVRIKFFRAQVCNLKATGKQYFRANLFRQRGNELVYKAKRRGWPKAGHCTGYPTPGIRTVDGHEYHVQLILSRRGEAGIEAVYTVIWEA